MGSYGLEIGRQYFAGRFDYDYARDHFKLNGIDKPRFEALDRQWHAMFDDWYRAHYAHNGDRVNPAKAMVIAADIAFRTAHQHMDLCYLNCAISSGTNPNQDAVIHHHHTSDKLGRVIGNTKHTWHNIVDNSARSLARARQVQALFPEMYFITPSSFEGSTRAFSGGQGIKLTGGLAFDGADYMAGWNMKIDVCKGFILDDVRLDMPSLDQVLQEIDAAQNWSSAQRQRTKIQTADWTNSRNSILEMARGNYIRFGLHPLRQDTQMDMRLYDEASNRLYHASLLDTMKPAVQHMLRWAPQGIATEEAVRTIARLIDVHRRRTDPAYNAAHSAPIDCERIDPRLRNPSQAEIHECDQLIRAVEPFILKYCPHLLAPAGLPQAYQQAYENSPIKLKKMGNDITNGQDIVHWQRTHIPAKAVAEIWELTQPRIFNPQDACPVRTALHGHYQPQRRVHDFHASPFDGANDERELWQDNPVEDLSELEQDFIKVILGTIETGMTPLDSPDFHGVYVDLKRGAIAQEQARRHHTHDISLLPARLGRRFGDAVVRPNAQKLNDLTASLQHKDGHSQAVFSSAQVRAINDAYAALRPDLAGPGPDALSPAARLALMMEMLRRNLTHMHFQVGWESSANAARLMVQATKIQFGTVQRPGGNETELAVLDEHGHPLSLYDRIERLAAYLDELDHNPDLIRHINARDANALEGSGVRHITLALARLLEIDDCLSDHVFGQNKFELQRVEDLPSFTRDMHKIQPRKADLQHRLQQRYAWLWKETDFTDLQRDYRDAWLETHGRQSQYTGPPPTDDEAITYRYGS